MDNGAILTPAEFTQLHNALCDLRSVHQRINDILNPELLNLMSQSIKSMEGALANSYQRDDEIVNNQIDYFSSVAELKGFDSVWSLMEVKCMYFDHPYTGANVLQYNNYLSSHQRWQPGTIEVTIKGPLWIHLWEAADQAIRESGDNHHIYIEGFSWLSEGVLGLSTGS